MPAPGKITGEQMSGLTNVRIPEQLGALYLIARRPQQRLYDRLKVQLRIENPRAFRNFMRISSAICDKIVYRLTPAFTRVIFFNFTRGWKWLPMLRPCFSSGTAADSQTTNKAQPRQILTKPYRLRPRPPDCHNVLYVIQTWQFWVTGPLCLTDNI